VGYTDITVDVDNVVGFTSHFANFVLLFGSCLVRCQVMCVNCLFTTVVDLSAGNGAI